MGVTVIFKWIADFVDDYIFLVALASFAIVFLPAWLPLLRPPPKVPGPFLHPEMWQRLPLVGKESLSHNTRRFRFALPHRAQLLGLPVGQHISLKADTDDGTMLLRPYTPVTDNDQRGLVDFVIKVYPEGRMSQHLDKMALGDCILAKGPKGRFVYERNMKKHIGMVAGGTGVTPMWQVLNHILRDQGDATRLSLIYANVTEDDILLRKELDVRHRIHGDYCRVFYTLNKPPPDWMGGKGFVTEEMCAQHLPPPGPDTLILRCGPLPMNQAVGAILDKLGYTADMQFQF